MSVNKSVGKTVKKTKEKVGEVIRQAKASLKILEVLEKEAVAKARGFIPSAARGRRLTHSGIASSLKKMGVASLSEVQDLRTRVERLEAELSALSARLQAGSSQIRINGESTNLPQS